MSAICRWIVAAAAVACISSCLAGAGGGSQETRESLLLRAVTTRIGVAAEGPLNWEIWLHSLNDPDSVESFAMGVIRVGSVFLSLDAEVVDVGIGDKLMPASSGADLPADVQVLRQDRDEVGAYLEMDGSARMAWWHIARGEPVVDESALMRFVVAEASRCIRDLGCVWGDRRRSAECLHLLARASYGLDQEYSAALLAARAKLVRTADELARSSTVVDGRADFVGMIMRGVADVVPIRFRTRGEQVTAALRCFDSVAVSAWPRLADYWDCQWQTRLSRWVGRDLQLLSVGDLVQEYARSRSGVGEISKAGWLEFCRQR